MEAELLGQANQLGHRGGLHLVHDPRPVDLDGLLGDAGRGAAIGAGVGALFGGFRRLRWHEEQQQQQQSYQMQQQSALAQGHANYNRAFGACMTGRGYTVS